MAKAAPINVTTSFPIEKTDTQLMQDVKGDGKNMYLKLGNPLLGQVFTFKVEPIKDANENVIKFIAYASFISKKDLLQAEKAVRDKYGLGCYRSE